MEDLIEDNNFITIIDFLGKIEGGVALILSMNIKDTIYEIIYWFDKKNNYQIIPSQKFLDDLNIVNINQYKHKNRIAIYIDKILLKDKKEKLFKEFKIT